MMSTNMRPGVRLRRQAWAGLVVLAMALTGVVGSGLRDRQAEAQAKPVLVFAAASLKNALDDITAQYERETGRKVSVSYAASPALARQIESGAPADLFISADLDWMDYLQTRNLIKTETRANWLGNRLVLVAPKTSTATVTIGPGLSLTELLGDGRLAMADPRPCPPASTGVPPSSRSASGRASRTAWPRPRTSARRSRWSLAARPRSGSCTRRTRPPIRTSGSPAPSPRTRIHPSSTRSR